MTVVGAGTLAGRVGIVTGGGKGLGRAFVLHLAQSGAHVVVNNRNRVTGLDGYGPADDVVAEVRATAGKAVAEHSDVADPEAAEAMLDAALTTYGRLDFLVTSAAVSNPEMFHKTSAERFDAVTSVNLAGTAHIAQLCSAHMRQAGSGRIVLVASTAGLHGEPGAAAYSASKGALVALGRAIAAEGARRDVLTNVVLPYATTQMTEAGMDQRYREAMSAEVVAPVITALVDSRCALNGEVLVCGGGGMRATSAVEWDTVRLPAGGFAPNELASLVAASRAGHPHEYPDAQSGFADFAEEARFLVGHAPRVHQPSN
jgi:NAD(P)-dependent dehydrogenase (short-subunit alcohol dehydrogenase family)